MKNAIAYIRVSTQKQGKSGLGLEAQQALIQRFADQEGFQIVQTFTEVQSGKDESGHSSMPRWKPLASPARPSGSRGAVTSMQLSSSRSTCR